MLRNVFKGYVCYEIMLWERNKWKGGRERGGKIIFSMESGTVREKCIINLKNLLFLAEENFKKSILNSYLYLSLLLKE